MGTGDGCVIPALPLWTVCPISSKELLIYHLNEDQRDTELEEL